MLSWLSADECFEFARNTAHRCHCDRDSCHLHSFTFWSAGLSNLRKFTCTQSIDILMALHIAYPAKRFFLLRGLAKRETAVYTSCVEDSYMEI